MNGCSLFRSQLEASCVSSHIEEFWDYETVFLWMTIYINIYICIYRRSAFNKFPDFFRMGIYNCRRRLKIKYVIAIHLMWGLTNFYYFSFKWTAIAATGIRPTKAWLSQLVNLKMQSGREDTLEERYAIKFCFKHGKNATEIYEILQTAFGPSWMNRTSVFEWHKRFKEGRESVRDDQRCERSKEVSAPELIGKRVRVTVKVTMLRF